MDKREFLELLQRLLRDAYMMRTAHDDPSGACTKFLVDQEQLMRNIEAELEVTDERN